MTIWPRAPISLVAFLCACGSSTGNSASAPTDSGAPSSSSDASLDQLTVAPADASATTDVGTADVAAASDALAADSAPPDATPVDAMPTGDGASVTCLPAPGSAVQTTGCSGVSLTILHDGTTPTVVLYGSVGAGQLTFGCSLVDSIDVLDSGGTTLQTLTGVTANLPADGSASLLATGPAASGLAAMCASDSNRFDGISLVMHGRTDGGTFVSTCGVAAPDTPWPPSVVVTCQTGVPAVPPTLSPAMGDVQVVSFMGVTAVTTTISAVFPQPPIFSTFASTLHLIPGAPPGGAPIMPSDSTGWSGYANSEGLGGSTNSGIELSNQQDALGTTLCPAACTTPDCPQTPVFIARMTGTTNLGAFSSEIFVRTCAREGP